MNLKGLHSIVTDSSVPPDTPQRKHRPCCFMACVVCCAPAGSDCSDRNRRPDVRGSCSQNPLLHSFVRSSRDALSQSNYTALMPPMINDVGLCSQTTKPSVSHHRKNKPWSERVRGGRNISERVFIPWVWGGGGGAKPRPRSDQCPGPIKDRQLPTKIPPSYVLGCGSWISEDPFLSETKEDDETVAHSTSSRICRTLSTQEHGDAAPLMQRVPHWNWTRTRVRTKA